MIAACDATQVAWQTLTDASASLASKAPPSAAVGAILTSQRLLVVSPELRILIASPSGVAITSCLWLGPALLYSTSDHQVHSSATAQVNVARSACQCSPVADLGRLARRCRHESLLSGLLVCTGHAAAMGRGFCQSWQLCCWSTGSAAWRSC